MGGEPHQIVREIELERSHLAHDLGTLEQRIKTEVGWRGRSILMVLGTAVVVAMVMGFFLGRAVRS